MSKKKLARIIVACGIATIVMALVIPPLLRCTPSVSVSPSEAGLVFPPGGRYRRGVQVPLTASPAAGYAFDHWSGSASDTTPTITITMDSNKSLTANFKAISFKPIVITGISDKTSAPFEVTTQEWIIDWSYIPGHEYPEYAIFGFFVYPRGDTVDYVESVTLPESTSGSTYSYAGPGEYYVKVICANIRSWKITIRPP
jgi:uncharacterized repeat protein (TIGR02543 family)